MSRFSRAGYSVIFVLMKLKPGDWVIIVLSLALIAFFSFKVYSGGSTELLVIIESSDSTEVYPLSQDRDVRASGPLGETVISIREGHVHVADSPCRDKLCVFAGNLDSAGEWTACLPNRVFVRLTGSEEAEVDEISY